MQMFRSHRGKACSARRRLSCCSHKRPLQHSRGRFQATGCCSSKGLEDPRSPVQAVIPFPSSISVKRLSRRYGRHRHHLARRLDRQDPGDPTGSHPLSTVPPGDQRRFAWTRIQQYQHGRQPTHHIHLDTRTTLTNIGTGTLNNLYPAVTACVDIWNIAGSLSVSGSYVSSFAGAWPGT